MAVTGQEVNVDYIPGNFVSGLTDVKCEIYDENGDEVVDSPFDMVERDDGGGTPEPLGIYRYPLTPGVKGEWTAICYRLVSSVKKQMASKSIFVEDVDIDDLATSDQVVTLASDVSAVKAKTDNLPADPADQSAVESAIAAAEANIRGGSETLDTIKDAIDNIAEGGRIL